jgi:hypothetical protein
VLGPEKGHATWSKTTAKGLTPELDEPTRPPREVSEGSRGGAHAADKAGEAPEHDARTREDWRSTRVEAASSDDLPTRSRRHAVKRGVAGGWIRASGSGAALALDGDIGQRGWSRSWTLAGLPTAPGREPPEM